MKVDVYDTYATSPDGTVLHFDIFFRLGPSNKKCCESFTITLAGLIRKLNLSAVAGNHAAAS